MLAMNAPGATPHNCYVCYRTFDGSAEFQSHLSSTRHSYNVELEAFQKDRKGKSKDRHGIVIDITCLDETESVSYNESKGIAMTNIDFAKPGIKYCFAIKHTGESLAILRDVCLLHPLKSFTLEKNLEAGSKPIATDETHKVYVSFNNPGIGFYDIPICFNLHSEGLDFIIIKEISIAVSRESPIENEMPEKSPFQGEVWQSEKMQIVRGVKGDGSLFKPFMEYQIPKDYFTLFQHKLQIWGEMTPEQMKTLNDIRSSYPAFAKANGKDFRDSYKFFFHNMLYLDEYATKAQLRTFNMTNVPITMIAGGQVMLKIPGLEEKRPSLIKNDIVLVRIRKTLEEWDTTAYEGQIYVVNERDVWITDFDSRLMELLRRNKTMNFDVRFMLNRFPLTVMHKAVDLSNTPRMLNILFPDCVVPMTPIAINLFRCMNPLVSSNPEQLSAVTNIVRGTSRPAPYIIFGPPGTGKTVTIVEAILQVKKLFPEAFILVSAPSNAACDNVALKLSAHCLKSELLRINASSRSWESVPDELHGYCNQTEKGTYPVSQKVVATYRIVVCTLITAGRFNASSGKGFTHVFIDEAGQAKEPEALAAIAGILGPASPQAPGGQLILAGDPKQLGPICSSRDAAAAGLGISMLQRLMTSCQVYMRKTDETYDPRFITKLLNNFRSHPALIEIPNKMFYGGELKVSCSADILNDPVGLVPLFTGIGVGYPLVFHGVIGQERKEGKSPSFFNQMELDTVMHYLSVLLDTNSNVQVKQSDIGIISPYIRQVYKLKGLIGRKGWKDIEVGTTEVFQGREKRIIVISTVRASRNLLAGDKKYKLGFLDNEKRFNVAITRARSLLVVVGCPHVLETDRHWRELIGHTKTHSSYHGSQFSLTEETWTNDVIEKFASMLKNDN